MDCSHLPNGHRLSRITASVPVYHSQDFNLTFTKGDTGFPSDGVSLNEPGPASISSVIVESFCPS